MGFFRIQAVGALIGIGCLFFMFSRPGRAAVAPGPAPRVCVLNFERASHPFTRMIAQAFPDPTLAQVVDEATPVDFQRCIQDDFTEIVIVAHALETDRKDSPIFWGYFKALDAERSRYQIKPILPQAFRSARGYLAERRDAGHPSALKSVRIMSCLPSEVLESYPDLTAMIRENGVSLDIAPPQLARSLLEGKEVTTLDHLWLAESAQAWKQPSPNEEWFFTYLNLKTRFLEQTGEALALHGQYRIQVEGLALGLESRWSALFIRYTDVEGLAVGEKRRIDSPHVDLSAGWGGHIEIGLYPRPRIQLPTEMNSVGVSVGLFSTITIERLY